MKMTAENGEKLERFSLQKFRNCLVKITRAATTTKTTTTKITSTTKIATTVSCNGTNKELMQQQRKEQE